MALHDTPISMIKESLPEFLKAAKFCVDYKKIDAEWKPNDTGGCLGFPGAVLLFSVVDSIGSYFRKDKAFKVNLNGKLTSINSDGYQHLFILNSKYFNQSLSEEYIKVLYAKFRSYLTHNNVLGKNAIMMLNDNDLPTEQKNKAFIEGVNSKTGDKVFIIVMNRFYELVENGVKQFLIDADTIVPSSKQGNKFN